MMQLQMLKMALIAYVNSMKAVWSAIAHPISIMSKRKGDLKDYRIYGNSVQNGTPTPEEPIEVQSVGELITEGEYTGKYKVPVTVRGKNLLDMSQHTVSQGVYLDNTGTAKANTRFIRISPIAVKPSTQYTLSVGSKYFLYTIWFFSGGDGTGIEKVNAFKLLKKTFTTPDNCNYIRVSIDSYYAGGTALVEDFEWAMLEKGEGDGIYEPYIESQTHNIYLDEPLKTGEVIQQSVDGLPPLPQFEGTTIYEVQTEVPPSGIEVCYYE